jgi:GGDEF domain-containing protein
VERPAGLSSILSQVTQFGFGDSVEAPPIVRALRPLSLGLWVFIFGMQAVAMLAGDTPNYLLVVLITLLFMGVQAQYWYEESQQGARFRHSVERMRGEVFEDQTTGLPNSRHFLDELRRQMMRSVRSGHGFAVILSDIAGNGAPASDVERLLPEATFRIQRVIGEGIFAARLEGAVLAVIVADEDDPLEKAREISDALDDVATSDLGTHIQPVVSLTCYAGEAEVRAFLRRANRDLMRARSNPDALQRLAS